ncbi:MAG: hypothetical protein IM600_14945 [Bacteroidetes bacterium]|nr:hypothetical protein [Bacteroidota bacterium]MCA6444727.1 hypothetical protein [Bacteroidota bacterium]
MLEQLTIKLENALKNLGINPESARIGVGQYNINKDKKVELMLDVWEQNNRAFFQVLCVVNKINDLSRTEVLQMLLEENHGLVQASFAISGNDILIKETLEATSFLGEEQLLMSIHRIAYYCEVYREKWNLVVN